MARKRHNPVLISKCEDMIIKRQSAIGIVKEYERLAKEWPDKSQFYLQHAEHYRRLV